jgi:hypothetical protein
MASLIDLLEVTGSSRDSPMSLIVLHLMELVGCAVSGYRCWTTSCSFSGAFRILLEML